MQVGIQGEEYAVFTEEGSKKVEWKEVTKGNGKSLSWYKVIVNGLKICKLFLGDPCLNFFTDNF